jgi:secondary thiamine-phosphate synthase enzyme
MNVHQDSFEIQTTGHRHLHRIDAQVEAVIAVSGIETGVVHVFNVGSTGSVGAIEYEPGLEEDLPAVLDRLIPPSQDYGHEQTWHDGNGHSHLQATLLGQAYSAPVAGGRLATGTWQQIVHLECDVKPRTRRIIVTVMGA